MISERQENIPLADGGTMRALLALPEGAPPDGGWPVVMAIHDIFGFSPDIQRIVRRFAESGYAAIAPALYDGAGAPFLCVVRTLRDQQRGEGPAFERLEAARRFVSGLCEIDGDRIAITGFCLGGGFAIFFAAKASPGDVKVAAPYYGETPDSADELTNVCPVVAGYGETDKSFAEHGRRLERNLQKLGVPHDVKIYPGVGHSYMNDHKGFMVPFMRHTPMHAAYDEAAAEDSWSRMLNFFSEHL